MAPRVIFVSGHLDLSPAEFDQHYAPRLVELAAEGCSFVVGDAPGCDRMAQQFLAGLRVNCGDYDCRPDITVFHMLARPRCLHELPGLPLVTRGGFLSDEERDSAMTHASHEDVAWVRPGKSKRRSGTQQNLDRRRERRTEQRLQEIRSWQPVRVSCNELWPVYGVSSVPEPHDDSPVQALSDDGMPIARQHPRLPQALIDRAAAASREFHAAQEEIRRLLAEQGYDE